MSGVQILTLGPDEAEQRLDRWIRRRFPDLGQGQIEKMCRKGEIRVDGSRVKAATRVGPGHSIRMPPVPDTPPDRRSDQHAQTLAAADIALIQAAVIYRDDHLLALNKPPGLPSQGGSKQTRLSLIHI